MFTVYNTCHFYEMGDKAEEGVDGDKLSWAFIAKTPEQQHEIFKQRRRENLKRLEEKKNREIASEIAAFSKKTSKEMKEYIEARFKALEIRRKLLELYS